ncbi:MAG TPA: enoyl-CoA hydratase/isomerase family protein, partial [Agriterribacter sp.]|nr:enoyl-CoA hydratase/isomerase family protein [Agriterribacter sp.]
MQTLLLSFQDNILTIAVNRPEKMNALNKTVIEELAAAIEDVYNNPDIKSAIITGAGAKAFVAGADISEFRSLD